MDRANRVVLTFAEIGDLVDFRLSDVRTVQLTVVILRAQRVVFDGGSSKERARISAA